MTNTFGVNITNRTAPASSGTLNETGTLFLIGKFGAGSATKPALIQSIVDFETFTGAGRTGEAVIGWDYLDVYFREGGNQAYVLNYVTLAKPEVPLALLDPRLGPGQVAMPYETPSKTIWAELLTHCNATNRVGLLDPKDGTVITAAALEALAKEANELTLPERVALCGFFTEAPGPAGVIGGTTRKVHPSASVAALCARVDKLGNPNVAAGGSDFPLRYASGLVYDPTDAERGAIFTKGSNTFKSQFSSIQNYGFVTPIEGTAGYTATPFWQLNCARTRMFITREMEKIAAGYYMKTIDGQGHLAAQFASDLKVPLKKLWERGGLYGEKPNEAFSVNVGVTVNTEAEVAAGHLNAVVSAKLSLYAAQVNVTLVSVPITGVVTP